ncbi:MAG: hypothetical protein ACLFUS_03480 [Candidatus Sumerlaeia bacterium]
MEYYDANEAQDPKVWDNVDEGEAIDAVLEYHMLIDDTDMPNLMLHATIHTTVEQQAALGDEFPVAAKIEQLMGEGLSRHEAIHAIGSVLVDQLFAIGKGEDYDDEKYRKKLKKLTKKSWYREHG